MAPFYFLVLFYSFSYFYLSIRLASFESKTFNLCQNKAVSVPSIYLIIAPPKMCCTYLLDIRFLYQMMKMGLHFIITVSLIPSPGTCTQLAFNRCLEDEIRAIGELAQQGSTEHVEQGFTRQNSDQRDGRDQLVCSVVLSDLRNIPLLWL